MTASDPKKPVDLSVDPLAFNANQELRHLWDALQSMERKVDTLEETLKQIHDSMKSVKRKK